LANQVTSKTAASKRTRKAELAAIVHAVGTVKQTTEPEVRAEDAALSPNVVPQLRTVRDRRRSALVKVIGPNDESRFR